MAEGEEQRAGRKEKGKRENAKGEREKENGAGRPENGRMDSRPFRIAAAVPKGLFLFNCRLLQLPGSV